jgi:hypothetical protein
MEGSDEGVVGGPALACSNESLVAATGAGAVMSASSPIGGGGSMPAAAAAESEEESCRRREGTAMGPLLHRVTCRACVWARLSEEGLRATRAVAEREDRSRASSCACMLCLWG